ncbi:hypothetical protein [Edaphobacter flagellatus]|uniref:hypothetical protein n=1 Tax=Edaphobacter flagellatus TaxID=1933044 RepID=UPI0021B3AA8F|nr:hypothetical protein [Edaphobacter flagellatus]
MTFPRTSHSSRLAIAFALTSALPLTAAAQAPTEPPRLAPQSAPCKSQLPSGPTILRTFFLKSSSQADQNEVLTALRNILDPRAKITLVPSQSAIVIDTTADQIEKVEKILNDLDRRHQTYRLTYTLIDFDGTKRIGDQHYSMVLFPGQRTTLKQGNKVPVVTGIDLKNSTNPQSQVAYIDVGMSFDATLDDASPNNIRLRAKVEQSSVVEASATAQDPVLRQAVYEGISTLTPGKPLTIGSLDTAGTTRRTEIQATVEPITN